MLVAACPPSDYFVLEHFIFLAVEYHLQGVAEPHFMLDSGHEPEGLNLTSSPKLFHFPVKVPSTSHDSEKWVYHRMIFQRRAGEMHKTVTKWPKSSFYSSIWKFGVWLLGK